VLAGAAPAVISELAIADDLAAGRLAEIRTPELDLRRTLRVIWDGAANPPAGPARDLVAHIASRATSPRPVAPLRVQWSDWIITRLGERQAHDE
jgi:hypothetical protein